MIVIIVTDKGHVEHKNLKLANVEPSDIKKTVNLINTLIVGTPIDEISIHRWCVPHDDVCDKPLTLNS